MRFLVLPIVTTFALVLAGCGGAEADESATPTSSATTAVTATATRTTPATASLSPSASATTPAAEATPTAVEATSTPTPARATPVPATPTIIQEEPTPTPTEPAAPLAAQVTVQNGSSFAPASVEIGVGGTVTWSWSGAAPHNVASDSAGFSSGYGASMTYSFTFGAPGTYDYLCEVHPTMRGVVVVK